MNDYFSVNNISGGAEKYCSENSAISFGFLAALLPLVLHSGIAVNIGKSLLIP